VRKWTKSACVMLAWCTLHILVVTGMRSPVHPAQAIHRIASSTTQVTLTAFTEAATPAATPKYVVQPGDTLSGIVAALAVRGGWQALYAANRHAIGPNPNIIRIGTVLVLPGQQPPVRYTVAPGDTLSGIAAALAIPGGWQALYAANRHAIGPNPNIIRVGTILTAPFLARQARPASHARRPRPPASRAKPGSKTRQQPEASAASASGMPWWLKAMLLVAGSVIGLALLTEPVNAMSRRHMRNRRRRLAAKKEARIFMINHERLIVTYSLHDDTVYVLTPPGEDPRAVLRAARLVLPEKKYQELAGQFGVPANWPME
jgi:LysM repeat protein